MSDRIYIGHEEFAEELALGEANGYLTLLPEGSLVISKENAPTSNAVLAWVEEPRKVGEDVLPASILALAEGIAAGADE